MVSVELAPCALSVVYWQPEIYEGESNENLKYLYIFLIALLRFSFDSSSYLTVSYLLQSLVRPVDLYNKCRESYHSEKCEDIYE